MWQKEAPAENAAWESSPETSVPSSLGEEENPGGSVSGQSPFWNRPDFCSDTGRLTAGPVLYLQGRPPVLPGESPEPQPRDLQSSFTSDLLLQRTREEVPGSGDPGPHKAAGSLPSQGDGLRQCL